MTSPSIVNGRSRLLALMQFVITSANFHVIGRATDRRSRMLLQPPQARMIQGPGIKFG